MLRHGVQGASLPFDLASTVFKHAELHISCGLHAKQDHACMPLEPQGQQGFHSCRRSSSVILTSAILVDAAVSSCTFSLFWAATMYRRAFAGRGSIRDALLYLAACAVDEHCTIRVPSDEELEHEDGHSEGRQIGLKAGLAAAFLAMTLLFSFLPTLFRRTPHFQVRSAVMCLLLVQLGAHLLHMHGSCLCRRLSPALPAGLRTLLRMQGLWRPCLHKASSIKSTLFCHLNAHGVLMAILYMVVQAKHSHTCRLRQVLQPPQLCKRCTLGFQGILCVLNAFSGSVFLTVGLIHLVPAVLEYQSDALPNMDYPLGLALVLMGFLVILCVEQVWPVLCC